MSNHQALIEALLMKSILGQELAAQHIHASHPTPSLVRQRRCSDSASEFFAQLLSRARSPDATFVDFDGGSAFDDGMALDDYGYASDSDLEDEEEVKASQTPPSDIKGNTNKSDDDDDDDDK
ncbi:uncharacterized protein BJ212DRAFT_1490142 [Suillus subaureus]|uniref:Uncharacterized protein n=1 Tax=Suillus subaureus TaxID=48587 RepID=A0A9P7ARN7_9AGAM|nr:uncharacterized protein BJ212DRAFT_1490142 [Suillus subaureus]KAG1794268.1 hypothetical protein BJ212DRAFT_1490142 [Suillus subaureus]